MPSGKKSKQMRRAAQSAPPPVRSKGSPAGRNDWLSGNGRWLAGGAAAVIAIVVLLIVLASGGSAKPVVVDFSTMTGLQTGAPPWNNGAGELQQRLSDVHLDPLSAEALAFHIHQHLDVYVNGTRVTVPALIGIYDNSFITEVHTHQPDGIIHIESAKNRPYTLGQFFGEWSVRLTANCLGKYCGHVRWWVNGAPGFGNPANLILRRHQEIVVAAGPPPARIPKSYTFPAGL